jgi:RNA polymerase primary sigma factor
MEERQNMKKAARELLAVKFDRGTSSGNAPRPQIMAETPHNESVRGSAAEPAVESESRQPYGAETAFNLYLREVGQTRLLTPEEEVALARQVKKGDKKAREQMIKANLRLVVKIARAYEGYGLPLLDLISEGNMGLMKAVERYDPVRGAKLSTYSACWIKQAIKRALANQSKTIRLPVHAVDKLFRIRRVAIMLQEVLGREPTDEELAVEVGLSPEKIAQLRVAALRPVSLEASPSDDESSGHISETVKDEKAYTPYEQLEEKTNIRMVRELTATLAPRELKVLHHRFGLNGHVEKTLDELGQKLGLTRERVRQIQNVALRKLRKGVEKLEGVRVAA